MKFEDKKEKKLMLTDFSYSSGVTVHVGTVYFNNSCGTPPSCWYSCWMAGIHFKRKYKESTGKWL